MLQLIFGIAAIYWDTAYFYSGTWLNLSQQMDRCKSCKYTGHLCRLCHYNPVIDIWYDM